MSLDVSSNPEQPAEPGMRQALVRGVRWSAVARYSVQTIQLATSLTLARLLAPANFGLMAMAMVFVEFTRICLNLGFSRVIVQRKQIDDNWLSSLFFFNLGLAALFTGILAAVSPLVAMFYGKPELTPILLCLATVVLINGPSLVPAALMNRQLRFKRLAAIDISIAVIQSSVAITMAVMGFEVWALVAGAMTSATARVVITNLASPWRPRLTYTPAHVREVFRFSANLTGFDVVNFFARKSDNVIIGKFLGETSLGFYSMAYRILTYPREAVTMVVGRVLLPTFSRLQDDDARLSRAYLRVCGAIAFVTFPMMLGLMAVADPFVRAVLDEKWLPALPLIYIFCPLGMLQSVGSTVGNLLIAKGRADLMFRIGLVRAVLIVGSFFAGLPWGIEGVAAAYAITILVLWIPSLLIVSRLVRGLNLLNFFAVLVPHAMNASIMAGLVFLIQLQLKSWGTAAWLNLLICVPAGMLLYSALVLSFRPAAMHDFLEIMPGFGSRKQRDHNAESDEDAKSRSADLSPGESTSESPQESSMPLNS